ncbi:MAG: hypothetical protein HY238_25760 [Acidobacteria bacterium]|nr:hypothetical protein [Acidobacteriota bacterium]
MAGVFALCGGIARGADKFTQECSNAHYPSPAPSQSLGIDAQCVVQGSGGDEDHQNRAKNNFCATGSPQPITLQRLKDLQKKVEDDTSIDYGDKIMPPRTKAGPTIERGPLHSLGEGRQVTFTGFVLKARQEGKESVNCGKNVSNTPLFHDIHISLVETANTKSECSGFVAEMSPHHRPAQWTAANINMAAKKSKGMKQKPQVRVTGHLFFDSSHRPCQGGQKVGSNPQRVSLWEIHPIYKFEVCGVGNCDAAEDKWLPLDEWVQLQKKK